MDSSFDEFSLFAYRESRSLGSYEFSFSYGAIVHESGGNFVNRSEKSASSSKLPMHRFVVARPFQKFTFEVRFEAVATLRFDFYRDESRAARDRNV